MKASVKEWIDFAGVDLLAAERLCNDEKLVNVVCFHCQQCVELHSERIPRSLLRV